MIPIGEYKKLLMKYKQLLVKHDEVLDFINLLYDGSDKLLADKQSTVSGYKKLRRWLNYQHYRLGKILKGIKKGEPFDEGKNS